MNNNKKNFIYKNFLIIHLFFILQFKQTTADNVNNEINKTSNDSSKTYQAILHIFQNYTEIIESIKKKDNSIDTKQLDNNPENQKVFIENYIKDNSKDDYKQEIINEIFRKECNNIFNTENPTVTINKVKETVLTEINKEIQRRYSLDTPNGLQLSLEEYENYMKNHTELKGEYTIDFFMDTFKTIDFFKKNIMDAFPFFNEKTLEIRFNESLKHYYSLQPEERSKYIKKHKQATEAARMNYLFDLRGNSESVISKEIIKTIQDQITSSISPVTPENKIKEMIEVAIDEYKKTNVNNSMEVAELTKNIGSIQKELEKLKAENDKITKIAIAAIAGACICMLYTWYTNKD